MKRRVLVVEDDPDIGALITMLLADLGCESRLIGDGQEALSDALANDYDLVILDLMLPGLNGIQVCGRLRGAERQMPIMMLTSKSTEIDRVLGLEIGADDYVTKPFSLREMSARVKGIFRRAELLSAALSKPEPGNRRIEAGDLEMDLHRHEVKVRGQVVELTAKEFDLLALFAGSPGRVFSRAQLLDQIWGYTHDGHEHTVNTHINRLRSKIELEPANPKLIQTVWGVGYKFTR